MKIINHQLHTADGKKFPFRQSPNVGGPLKPRFLVLHYTAGRSAESSINWFTRPEARASAHLVIGRDGSITQMAPFNRVTWHAGKSEWNELTGLNSHSIGIEIDNAGKLTKVGNQWMAWFMEPYPDNEVILATHKFEDKESGWHVYTPAQIDAVVEVTTLLVRHYKLEDVLGHEDISPKRKFDPGPAFPIHNVRAKALGRQEDQSDIFEVRSQLNIRLGPGTNFATLPESPLPKGTRVFVEAAEGAWRFVEVMDEVKGAIDLQGWVHGGYLKKV